MIRVTDLVLSLEQAGQLEVLRRQAAKRLKISPERITEIRLAKQSVDARKKDAVVLRCAVDVAVAREEQVLQRAKDAKSSLCKPFSYQIPRCKVLEKRPVVVGFGPAGMFAALLLAQAGQRPIVLERGAPVEERQQQVQQFWQSGDLDPESNVQFGEGGAGTFSDGKLNTGTKDKRARKVLEELHEAGAPAEILIEAQPHVGTDKLPQTVRTIREKIISLGGTVRFHTKLTGLQTKGGKVSAVVLEHGTETEMLETDHVILAIGHSARDTYEMLRDMQIVMEQKPFSIGARIEHLQAEINRSQYGKFAQHPVLGAAAYKQAVHLPSGRGVYTFCMCPGGEVVAASSEAGMVVTNGMSNFARDGKNANAALLVGITPEDFGDESPLAGMELQRRLERAAFVLGGEDYKAPAQRIEDFLQNRRTTAFGAVAPTYTRGVVGANLQELFPAFVAEAMAAGIQAIDRRMHGFAHPDGVLTGPETRSSAPVRLLRNAQYQSVGLEGLYPCGEGAGYAGGIVSAAVDGLRCAEQILAACEGSN